MNIKEIRIQNFKSFKNLEIKLNKNYNVLIGANASGKTNFIQIFKFFKDIINNGLENAIFLQGGIEYFTNINIGSSQNFSLEIVLNLPQNKRIIKKNKKDIELEFNEFIYYFSLGFKKRGLGYKILEEKLILKFDIEVRKEKKIEKAEINIINKDGEINITTKLPNDMLLKEEDISPFLILLKKIKQLKIKGEQKLFSKFKTEKLLIEQFPLYILLPITPLINFDKFFSVYDFDPKLSKKATPISGEAELKEDGSNLVLVLKNIIEEKTKKRKLFNILNDFLPFVSDLSYEKLADRSLILKLRENYTKKQYLPSSLISDGTINITALIIALYFEKIGVTIIEEPERNIHPYLISKIMEMIKDASKNKQIIVTTHNPELLKYTDLENILLIARDKEGFSTISKPYEKEMVKKFLKNELGIEDLYVKNLLS